MVAVFVGGAESPVAPPPPRDAAAHDRHRAGTPTPPPPLAKEEHTTPPPPPDSVPPPLPELPRDFKFPKPRGRPPPRRGSRKQRRATLAAVELAQQSRSLTKFATVLSPDVQHTRIVVASPRKGGLRRQSAPQVLNQYVAANGRQRSAALGSACVVVCLVLPCALRPCAAALTHVCFSLLRRVAQHAAELPPETQEPAQEPATAAAHHCATAVAEVAAAAGPVVCRTHAAPAHVSAPATPLVRAALPAAVACRANVRTAGTHDGGDGSVGSPTAPCEATPAAAAACRCDTSAAPAQAQQQLRHQQRQSSIRRGRAHPTAATPAAAAHQRRCSGSAQAAVAQGR